MKIFETEHQAKERTNVTHAVLYSDGYSVRAVFGTDHAGFPFLSCYHPGSNAWQAAARWARDLGAVTVETLNRSTHQPRFGEGAS